MQLVQSIIFSAALGLLIRTPNSLLQKLHYIAALLQLLTRVNALRCRYWRSGSVFANRIAFKVHDPCSRTISTHMIHCSARLLLASRGPQTAATSSQSIVPATGFQIPQFALPGAQVLQLLVAQRASRLRVCFCWPSIGWATAAGLGAQFPRLLF